MNSFEKYLGDTYKLIEVIKSDEKNFIARIFDKNSKRLCTLKKRSPKSAELYKILKNLNCSYIPEIYRIFESAENLFVIEEHIDGQTLEEILTYQTKNFDEKFVTNIFLQICDCLKILHEKNIIHRDLRLSNIMLSKNNSVKIIDFGIARIFKPEKISDTEFLGTRGYAAPEQYGLFDLEQSDPRTDIFVLGIATKKLLGENYHGYLEKILNRCTNLNPNLRYKNISEIVQDIKRTRKIFLVKKISVIFSFTFIIFFITQFLNFENKKDSSPEKIEEKILIDDKPAEQNKNIEVQNSETKSNSQFPNDLIEFTKNPISNIPTTPEINISPISPAVPEPIPQKKSDRIKLFLYINGQLTENRGEHTTAGDFYITENFQNWQLIYKGKYQKYLLFPANWTARLKVENFTEQNLNSPKFLVNFSGEEIFIDKPTIKSGETIYFDIPIANKRALDILGENHFNGSISISVESPSKNIISNLHRDLEVIKSCSNLNFHLHIITVNIEYRHNLPVLFFWFHIERRIYYETGKNITGVGTRTSASA